MDSHNLETRTRVKVFDKTGRLKLERVIEKKPKTQNSIDTRIYDRNLNLIREEKLPFRSFTNNFGKWLHRRIIGGNINALSTVNTWQSLSFGAVPVMTSAAGNHTTGILVGAGTTDVAFTDWNLASQIFHGTGAGQILYGATNLANNPSAVTFGSFSGMAYQISRTFTNSGVSNVTVREIGAATSGATNRTFLIMRDRTSWDGTDINIIVQPNQIFEVKYNIAIESTGFLNENFLKTWKCMFDNSPITYTSTTGVVQTLNIAVELWAGCPANQSSFGIVVGTGNTAKDMSHYQLASKVNHSPDFVYNDMPLQTYVENATDNKNTVKRSFVNNSATPITIREVGLYLKGSATEPEDNKKIMIARELIGDTTLNQLDTLEVTFEFITHL